MTINASCKQPMLHAMCAFIPQQLAVVHQGCILPRQGAGWGPRGPVFESLPQPGVAMQLQALTPVKQCNHRH